MKCRISPTRRQISFYMFEDYDIPQDSIILNRGCCFLTGESFALIEIGNSIYFCARQDSIIGAEFIYIPVPKSFWAGRKYYKILSAAQFYAFVKRYIQAPDCKLFMSYDTPWYMNESYNTHWSCPNVIPNKDGSRYPRYAEDRWMRRFSDHARTVQQLALPLVLQEDLIDLVDDFNNRANWKHKILQTC
jgi:hypothetical protein